MSLNIFINTLQVIADTPEVETEPKNYPIEEYITNAIACMMEGLPNDFYLAYVKYSKSVSESDANVINISLSLDRKKEILILRIIYIQ